MTRALLNNDNHDWSLVRGLAGGVGVTRVGRAGFFRQMRFSACIALEVGVLFNSRQTPDKLSVLGCPVLLERLRTRGNIKANDSERRFSILADIWEERQLA